MHLSIFSFIQQQYDPNIATPFSDQEALEDEKKHAYNECHILARGHDEQTIGITKKRYPILRVGIPFRNLEKCAKLILGLYGVHNFILENCGNEDEFSFL